MSLLKFRFLPKKKLADYEECDRENETTKFSDSESEKAGESKPGVNEKSSTVFKNTIIG